MPTVQLQDHTLLSDARELTVDRAERVIRNVMAVGNSSSNRGGIFYGDALEDAVGLYDAKPVIMAHRDREGAPLGIMDAIAFTKNPRRVAGGVLVDLVGAAGRVAEFDQLMDVAEHSRGSWGLSQEGLADMVANRDKSKPYANIVKKFRKIEALALTDRPASTRTLADQKDKNMPLTLDELRQDHPEAARLIDEQTRVTDAKLAELTAKLAERDGELAALKDKITQHETEQRFNALVAKVKSELKPASELSARLLDSIRLGTPEAEWDVTLRDAMTIAKVVPTGVNYQGPNRNAIQTDQPVNPVAVLSRRFK